MGRPYVWAQAAVGLGGAAAGVELRAARQTLGQLVADLRERAATQLLLIGTLDQLAELRIPVPPTLAPRFPLATASPLHSWKEEASANDARVFKAVFQRLGGLLFRVVVLRC